MLKKYSLVFLSLLFSCQPSPKYTKTVEYLDIDSFMGEWFVHAGRFTPFENEVFNGREVYRWDEKSNKIEIQYIYNRGGYDGPEKILEQTGRVFDEQSNAHWKVSPFWFIEFDFLVIALNNEEGWTAIGVPNQKYLWIMSRKPKMPADKLQKIVKYLEKKGYDASNLEKVSHSPNTKSN